MPMSDYLRQLREKVGHDLLVLPSAAVAVRDAQGRLLVCLHADKNIWVAPGGLIEPGEHPADAAVRETWEETGFTVELTGILGVFGGPDLIIDYPNGDMASYIGTIFRGRVTGGTLRPDGQEILEVRYLTEAELLEVPHSKWMNAAMPILFDSNAAPHFRPSTWKPE
ncbi:MAG: NUDIX domain-containing protein [Acidobacteria bacterium]|nr:NUDIX domain-containing protein [Acidobacteriota bacterium]